MRGSVREVLSCIADSDDPTTDPRFGKMGKQKCEDTGPLTRKRMGTVEKDLLKVSTDFMERSVRSGKPFFLWHNTTRMHVWTRLSSEWENKSGFGLYADGMLELDWIVGQLLKKLDDLGIASNTIVVFTTDNGAQKFSWPDGGTSPYRGEGNNVGRRLPRPGARALAGGSQAGQCHQRHRLTRGLDADVHRCGRNPEY